MQIQRFRLDLHFVSPHYSLQSQRDLRKGQTTLLICQVNLPGGPPNQHAILAEQSGRLAFGLLIKEFVCQCKHSP